MSIPHGIQFADALAKLQGLALYAEAHRHIYRRIEAVAEVDGKLRMLDLMRADVRNATAIAKSIKALYQGILARDYE